MGVEELERELAEYSEEITENKFAEPTRYRVVFSRDVAVCHNKLLERLRSLGYEVYCFGKNHKKYPDNFTGTFVEV